MNIEIERKWVAGTIPTPDVLGPGDLLQQGYLAEEGDVSVRLRISQHAAILTMKAGGGLARTEVELTLAPDQAEALWPHTQGRRLEKTRHRVPVGDHVAEVDVYAGDLAGLCTVEVEFGTEPDAVAFVPPAWFGREVTGDVSWTNASLARRGRPG